MNAASITTANVSSYVRSLSWNMIDFYIHWNVENVMIYYMSVVIFNFLEIQETCQNQTMQIQ